MPTKAPPRRLSDSHALALVWHRPSCRRPPWRVFVCARLRARVLLGGDGMGKGMAWLLQRCKMHVRRGGAPSTLETCRRPSSSRACAPSVRIAPTEGVPPGLVHVRGTSYDGRTPSSCYIHLSSRYVATFHCLPSSRPMRAWSETRWRLWDARRCACDTSHVCTWDVSDASIVRSWTRIDATKHVLRRKRPDLRRARDVQQTRAGIKSSWIISRARSSTWNAACKRSGACWTH